MTKTARLTSKGQVTIPRDIRRALRLTTGDDVVFEQDRDGCKLRRLSRTDVFERYRGIGNPGIPSGRKGVVRWIRQLRGHED